MKAAILTLAFVVLILASALAVQAAPKAERPDRVNQVDDIQFCRKCEEPKLVW